MAMREARLKAGESIPEDQKDPELDVAKVPLSG